MSYYSPNLHTSFVCLSSLLLICYTRVCLFIHIYRFVYCLLDSLYFNSRRKNVFYIPLCLLFLLMPRSCVCVVCCLNYHNSSIKNHHHHKAARYVTYRGPPSTVHRDSRRRSPQLWVYQCVDRFPCVSDYLADHETRLVFAPITPNRARES